jgi:hypothetical protein
VTFSAINCNLGSCITFWTKGLFFCYETPCTRTGAERVMPSIARILLGLAWAFLAAAWLYLMYFGLSGAIRHSRSRGDRDASPEGLDEGRASP